MKNFKNIKSILKSRPNNLFNFQKRNIYYNPKIGYYAPEQEDYFLEVKEWLTNLNPQLLCIYFTNDWNPICKKAEKEYPNFIKNNQKVLHLKINTDKHPRLRWFFDAKMEPSMKLYYHGALVKTLGGCNFEKYGDNIKRAFEFINHTQTSKESHGKEYELPYYKWEADLDDNGNQMMAESTGSWVSIGWKGFYTFSKVPGDNYLMHVRMKK